ncbi:MAG: glutamate-1-semialdehyde 2,1-aminomutase [Saprospiraceae bacterium]|nr:glutamate-1-semialdehyde 2,1-aminomutase [Saprospiraceae bacterium]
MQINFDFSKRKKSAALFEKAKELFPGGVSSPVRAFKSVVGPPLFIKSAKGCHLVDEDDNVYIDYCSSWGPMILGHQHPHVKEAILKALDYGTSFGAPTRYENELGEIIINNHRFIEKLRFVSSGTEAVMSAIRLARAATGRTKIIKFEGCYHGHTDALLVKAGSGLVTFGVSSSAGIPESFAKETIVVPLNDLEKLHQVIDASKGDVACIIIEPIPANNGLLLQDKLFLESLRKICDQNGILLLFDEVISGFRVGFEGASGHYNIKPDIITFGKIIGGGMPVGAYGASAEIMSFVAPDGPMYQAGTLSGNPIAMAAGKATLEILLEHDFYNNLTAKTTSFVDAIVKHCDAKGYDFSVPQIGSIFWLTFSKNKIRAAHEIDASSMDLFKMMHYLALDAGLYFGPSGYEVGFISAAHTDEILEQSSEVLCNILDKVYQ